MVVHQSVIIRYMRSTELQTRAARSNNKMKVLGMLEELMTHLRAAIPFVQTIIDYVKAGTAVTIGNNGTNPASNQEDRDVEAGR